MKMTVTMFKHGKCATCGNESALQLYNVGWGCFKYICIDCIKAKQWRAV